MKQTVLLAVFFAVSFAVSEARGQAGAENIVGQVYSGEASPGGSLVLASGGMPLLSGSQVSAGYGAALVRLTRGGQLRVCPKTNLALSADPVGKSMVLGLNVGSMELDYSLSGGADLLMTPDLQLQLISPGTFHLAVSVGPTGDTCVHSLPGSSAAVFVSEMMGNDHYQIAPGKSVLFGGGRISGVTMAPSVCGCPAPPPQLASGESGAAATWAKSRAASETQAPEKSSETAAHQGSAPAAGDGAAAKSATADASAPAHLESNSSFVYRGDEGQDLYTSVSSLGLSTDNSQLAMALLPKVTGPEEASAPPPAPAAAPQPAQAASEPETQPAPEAKHGGGLFRSIGHFFGRLFR